MPRKSRRTRLPGLVASPLRPCIGLFGKAAAIRSDIAVVAELWNRLVQHAIDAAEQVGGGEWPDDDMACTEGNRSPDVFSRSLRKNEIGRASCRERVCQYV